MKLNNRGVAFHVLVWIWVGTTVAFAMASHRKHRIDQEITGNGGNFSGGYYNKVK